MRLAASHKHWVYWSAAGLFASGALWLLFHYFVRVHGEFGETAHPLETWWLRLHGAAAMLCLVLVGSLLPIHVRRGWHQRRNLGPGLLLLLAAMLLALTGYGLYYIGGEELRPAISAVHWLIGLATPFAMVWHIRAGRAAAQARTMPVVTGVPRGRRGPDEQPEVSRSSVSRG
jgi:hypothetical protein